MIHLCRVKVQPSGAIVPSAFKQALYLDAFGWTKPSEIEEKTITDDSHAKGSKSCNGPTDKPAMSAIKYSNAGTRPFLPQDLAPNVHGDSRGEEGSCEPDK